MMLIMGRRKASEYESRISNNDKHDDDDTIYHQMYKNSSSFRGNK